MFRAMLARLFARQVTAPIRNPRPAFRPRLDGLEDRTVPSTLVYTDTYTWTGPPGAVEVTVTVTADEPGHAGRYVWNYHVENQSFSPEPGPNDGIAAFTLQVDASGDIADFQSSVGWAGQSEGLFGYLTWQEWETNPGNFIKPTEDADFSFTTPPSQIATSVGAVFDYQVASEAGGDVVVPGAALPVITVAAGADATEGGASGSFVFARTGDLSQSLTVNYAVATIGPLYATPGDDYAALSGTITFPAGSASVDLSVAPYDDDEVEGDETVAVTLSEGSNYAVGDSARAALYIVDDDVWTGVIGGMVWADADGNGIHDSGETGAGGVGVWLLSDDDVIATTTSDENGGYRFEGLPAGSYSVSFVPAPAQTLTAPATGAWEVTLADGDQVLTADAGVAAGGEGDGEIGDLVWYDTDEDGYKIPVNPAPPTWW